MSSALEASPSVSSQPHRCPWWIGWLLASPARRLLERPEDLVLPLVASGSRVLEVGPGMGFFTLPMAQRVGLKGRIYCVEAQPQMLSGLERRLRARGLGENVETRRCTATELGVGDLRGSIDLAVVIHVLHELEEPRGALREITDTLRPGGRILLIEPSGHVSHEAFLSELELARQQGLIPVEHSMLTLSRRHLVALMERASA